MKTQYQAHIESNGNGFFSVYTNANLPFGIIGEGYTAEEAKADFVAVFNEMAKHHKERTGETVEAEFTFVKDISAILQECKSYISLAWLAKITGINKAQLSQYACGTRHPKPAQREKIISGIHNIGNACLSVQ